MIHFIQFADASGTANHTDPAIVGAVIGIAGVVIGAIMTTVGLYFVERKKSEIAAREEKFKLYALLLLELYNQQVGFSLDLDALLPAWLTRLDKVALSRPDALAPSSAVRELQKRTSELHKAPHELYDEFFSSLVASGMGPTIYLHYSRVKAYNSGIRDHPNGFAMGDFADLVRGLGHMMEGSVEMINRIFSTKGFRQRLTVDHKLILESEDGRLKEYEFLAALCRTDLETLEKLEKGFAVHPSPPVVMIENPENLRKEWIRRAKLGS